MINKKFGNHSIMLYNIIVINGLKHEFIWCGNSLFSRFAVTKFHYNCTWLFKTFFSYSNAPKGKSLAVKFELTIWKLRRVFVVSTTDVLQMATDKHIYTYLFADNCRMHDPQNLSGTWDHRFVELRILRWHGYSRYIPRKLVEENCRHRYSKCCDLNNINDFVIQIVIQ